MRFSIGRVQVTVIVDDGDFQHPLRRFLPDLDVAALDEHRGLLEPAFVDIGHDILRCPIQTFVLNLEGRIVVVDTCVGEHKSCPEFPTWNRRSSTGFLDRMRAAGVPPEAVDLVFCTHLHIDHVGWNTICIDGAWVPTFPHARYLVGRREFADWQSRTDPGTDDPLYLRVLRESVVPLVEADRVDLVDDGSELAPGAVLTPLPGHTAGQIGLLLDRPDARALFCGDAVHSPVQILQPTVSTSVCQDPGLAARTRTAVLQEAAATGRVLVPAHFRRVTVVRRGDGFQPVFAA